MHHSYWQQADEQFRIPPHRKVWILVVIAACLAVVVKGEEAFDAIVAYFHQPQPAPSQVQK